MGFASHLFSFCSYYSDTPVYSVRWYKNGKEFYRWEALDINYLFSYQLIQAKRENWFSHHNSACWSKTRNPIFGSRPAITPHFSLQLLQSLCCNILWHFYSAQVIYHCPEMHHIPPPSLPPLQSARFLPHFLHLFHLFSSSFRPGRERPISVHPVAGVTVEVEGSSIHQVKTLFIGYKSHINLIQIKNDCCDTVALSKKMCLVTCIT